MGRCFATIILISLICTVAIVTGCQQQQQQQTVIVQPSPPAPSTTVIVQPSPPAKPTSRFNVTISSVTGWQQTPLYLHRGDSFYVVYQSGGWTVDHTYVPRVGPEGYPPNIDQKISQCCKYTYNAPYATLLGMVGDGNLIIIGGRGGPFYAENDGTLFLRINDSDDTYDAFSDNAGAITVTISSK